MCVKFSDIIIENRKMWFVPSNVTGLVEADLDSNQSLFIGQNKGQVILASNKYGPIQKLNSDIVIAPVFGEDFYQYNLDSGIYKKLRMTDYQEDFLRERDKYGKFQAAFSNDENMYFIGVGYSGIAKIDTKTWNGRYINIQIDKDSLFGRCVGICEETVYIPIRNKNKMLIYHLKSDEYEIQSVGIENCIAICAKENKLCCIPSIGSRIEIYDIKTQKLQEIHLPDKIEGKKSGRWYCTAVNHCNFVWVFPFYSNMIMRIDTDTGNAICVHMFHDDSEASFLNAGICDEDTIWGFDGKKNELVLIDCKSLRMERKRIMPPQNTAEYMDIEKGFELYKTKAVAEGYLDLKGLIHHILLSD